MNGPIKAAGEAMPSNKATDAKVAEAMRELSVPIYDLMNMARITADIAESIFDCPDKSTEDRITFSVHPSDRDSFLFAINNIEERAKGLNVRHSAAHRGEIVQ